MWRLCSTKCVTERNENTYKSINFQNITKIVSVFVCALLCTINLYKFSGWRNRRIIYLLIWYSHLFKWMNFMLAHWRWCGPTGWCHAFSLCSILNLNLREADIFVSPIVAPTIHHKFQSLWYDFCGPSCNWPGGHVLSLVSAKEIRWITQIVDLVLFRVHSHLRNTANIDFPSGRDTCTMWPVHRAMLHPDKTFSLAIRRIWWA